MTHKNDDNKDSAVDCVVTDNAVVNGITDSTVACVINSTSGNAIIHGYAEIPWDVKVLDPIIRRFRREGEED